VGPALLIPWFRLEPLAIPLPWAGELRIQPFGVLAAVAILVGVRFARLRARQLGVGERDLIDFLTWTTAVGLASAYVLNAVLYHPQELLAAAREPSRLLSRYWGLSSYGGFLGGTLTAIVFIRRRGLPLTPLADVWCFAIPFAWIFARTGCFVVHDHPGAVSDFWLAVDRYGGSGPPRHDLGLYEVLWSLGVAPLFFWLARRPRPAGFFVGLLLLLYGPMRFGLDFLRIAEAEGGDARYLGLTPAQYFSLAITILGVLLIRARVGRGAPPSSARSAPALPPSGTGP
jgi:phosphatidylglycerol:prolipoprotein diacylglycerol transferase